MGEPAAAHEASSTASTEPEPAPVASAPRDRAGALRAGWAVAGVVLLLADAIYRLGLRAVETLAQGASGGVWLAFALLSTAFVYGEGYRALQLRFAPRVIARAFAIDGRRPHHVALAPLVALSLLGGSARELTRGYVAAALIISAALLVSLLSSPWRGVIDGAVALALGWGAVALLVQFRRALRSAD